MKDAEKATIQALAGAVDTTKYPYTLDAPLKEALKLALDAGDDKTTKMVWKVYISYRKSS